MCEDGIREGAPTAGCLAEIGTLSSRRYGWNRCPTVHPGLPPHVLPMRLDHPTGTTHLDTMTTRTTDRISLAVSVVTILAATILVFAAHQAPAGGLLLIVGLLWFSSALQRV